MLTRIKHPDVAAILAMLLALLAEVVARVATDASLVRARRTRRRGLASEPK